ncbi:MAG: cell division inhibitor MinD [Candidatus Cloacimonetes bacterium ADurb.Bin117]|jgi:MinD superfamily P-loop ATPase|nr:MAG: cell division inhibitor MinD [Candidatus Cloacimonetes bacterium ADurb.Bin117]
MKEIVIISGKGGTGKTSVAAALASIASQTVMADCDVDAADLHLILKPETRKSEAFFSGVKAVIDPNKCSSCGLCQDICRFDAVCHQGSVYRIDPLDCEGCGYCHHICPVDAIDLQEQQVGYCYISDTKYDCQLVHAKLEAGADNSGKLVAKVKKDAKEIARKTGMNYILVDGSPGIGCPVISSLSGADFVLLVTEPTLSGLGDMQRVNQLVEQFKIPTGCLINKSDINPEVTEKIRAYIQGKDILQVDEIPYDEEFSQAITLGQSLVEFNPAKWQPRFTKIWQTIIKELQ